MLNLVMSGIRQNRGVLITGSMLATVLLAYVLYPVLKTLADSLWGPAGFTLSHYADFFDVGRPSGLQALWTSTAVSLGSVVLAGLIGIPLAYLFTEYDFPFRRTFSALAVVPLALPPLVGVISFLFIYGESGIIPRGLQFLFDLDSVPFSIEGYSAVLLVHAYSFYVYFYLFCSAALQNIDASLRDAAHNLGSGTFRYLRKVLFPLLTPAAVSASLLTFMQSMASFSAPFLFAGDKRFLTVEIYNSKLNGNLELAAVQAIVLSVISILFLVYMRHYSEKRRYVLVSKGVSARRTPVTGGFRYALGAVGIVAVVLLLLPIIGIVMISLVQEGSWTYQILPEAYTWDNYAKLFNDEATFQPILNSLQISTVATAANVAFGIAAAFLLTKRRFKTRRFWEILTMLPIALPGTVIAFNLIVTFNEPTWLTGYQVLVGTFWILPLAYFVRHIPFVVRSTAASLELLDDALEDAAKNLGAGWFRVFRRVTVPIILPGILAGTLLTFVIALGEFVSSILLYVYDNRPISIEILSELRLYDFGSAAAYSVFLMVLIVLVLVLTRRVFKTRAGTAF